jgi:hypothetical protein
MNMKNNYCVFILTHGRPDKVITIPTLRDQGYTGRIILVVDDEDKTAEEYKKLHGKENVVVFSKNDAATITDPADNLGHNKGVVFARNAIFSIAENLGYKYFIVLDDDYKIFEYKVNYYTGKVCYDKIKDLDRMFASLLDYYITSGLDCLAIGQGGDYIGGGAEILKKKVKRKLMNFFICSTDRPFKFMGRTNEDTTCYTYLGSTGKKFLSVLTLSLEQKETQTNPGGLTEIYLETGTYVKSFYTVMFHPSSVKVSILNSRHPRLHHQVNWNNTVPKILREDIKKYESKN